MKVDTSHLQRTVARPVHLTGVGLHSGAPVALAILPADVGTGIVFVRVDENEAQIPAAWNLVTETMLGTTLTNPAGVSIATVEHLMAALWGAGVDNARVMIDGPEVPILDGSSAPFTESLLAAGVVAQRAAREIIQVLRPVEVRDGDAYVRLFPFEGFSVDMAIEFSHPAIACQNLSIDFDDATFEGALADARTFGFAHEVEMLRKAGLARGGSLDNAIVIGVEGVLNPEGLRSDDEFVRHKVLDCIGDLFLARRRLQCRVEGRKSGHRLNNLVLRALFAQADAWRLVTARPLPVAVYPTAHEAAALAY